MLPLNERKGGSSRRFLELHPIEMPGIEVDSYSGDIVFFSQKIYHGVYGMQPGRRFLKLRFAGKLETDEQIASFMRYNRRSHVYEPEEVFAESDHPRIRAMVDPLIELTARTEAERERFDALGANEDRY